MSDKLEALKAAALAIGHECWVQDGSSVNTEDYRIANGEMCCDHIGCFESVNGESPHAKYVAAASPAVALELLAALEAKDKRIAELEAIATEYAGKFQKAQDAAKHLVIMNDSAQAEIVQLKTLLATPVRLPDVLFIKVSGSAVPVMHAERVKERVQAAGFTVGG